MRHGEFKRAVEDGEISGHVGLEQSIAMIASALGWKLDRIEVGAVEPVMLGKTVQSNWVEVEPGKVVGGEAVGKEFVDGKPLDRA